MVVGDSLTFSIESESSSVCTISGSKVSFIGAGMCTIYAFEAGNADYQNGSEPPSRSRSGSCDDAVLSPATQWTSPIPPTRCPTGEKGGSVHAHGPTHALPAGIEHVIGRDRSRARRPMRTPSRLHSFTVTAMRQHETYPPGRDQAGDHRLREGDSSPMSNLREDRRGGGRRDQRTIATGLHSPNGLAVDPAGDVYVSEAGSNGWTRSPPQA